MKSLSKINQTSQPVSFLGHAGTGARLTIVKKKEYFIVQESVPSQLVTIVSLALLGFYPAWLLIFKSEKINGGFAGLFILGLTSLVAFPFFIKYLRRLLGQRRIEFHPKDQKILFINEKKEIEKTLSFLTVAKLDIQTFEFRSDGATTPNFTLSLVELAGTSHPLGTSEKKENVVLIQQTLSPYFPLKQIQ